MGDIRNRLVQYGHYSDLIFALHCLDAVTASIIEIRSAFENIFIYIYLYLSQPISITRYINNHFCKNLAAVSTENA